MTRIAAFALLIALLPAAAELLGLGSYAGLLFLMVLTSAPIALAVP